MDSVRQLSGDQILKELATLCARPATDRHLYCVFGPYLTLRPFQKRIEEQVRLGNLKSGIGRMEYLSLNRDMVLHMKEQGTYEEAANLADRGRDEELRQLLSRTFRDLITRRIETPSVAGLLLADFELLYAYDLGGNDISLARQVAINGRRVCLLVPGVMRDGRLWIFDEDAHSRREFPEALVFKGSGWVFELVN